MDISFEKKVFLFSVRLFFKFQREKFYFLKQPAWDSEAYQVVSRTGMCMPSLFQKNI